MVLERMDPGEALSLEDEGGIFITLAPVEAAVQPESEEHPET